MLIFLDEFKFQTLFLLLLYLFIISVFLQVSELSGGSFNVI